jgi:outer membrane translocation and assembly module TamA
VDLQIPAALGEAFHQGAKYRVTYARFADQELDRYSFRRLDAEAQQRFALFGAQRRLTLHGWVSTTETDPGHDVPIHLQRTLGGKGSLRSVHEEIIGSDGTRATLRGFKDYRFRDRHLLLLQAEYRVPLWGPVDASVFADAGKVTRRRKDLSLSDLKRNYGFGISMMRGPSTIVRVDLGLGSGEGARVLFSIGSDLVR